MLEVGHFLAQFAAQSFRGSMLCKLRGLESGKRRLTGLGGMFFCILKFSWFREAIKVLRVLVFRVLQFKYMSTTA